MEYIIKYTGDILSLGYPTELLDAQFAIMELEPDQAERLLEHSQVTCYEPERSLSCMADRAMELYAELSPRTPVHSVSVHYSHEAQEDERGGSLWHSITVELPDGTPLTREMVLSGKLMDDS